MEAQDDGSLPVGCTTGLSHEHSAAVEEAAAWLTGLPKEARPRPLVPVLRLMFGLSPVDACAAIRAANKLYGERDE